MIDKSLLKAHNNTAITQSLFLELSYSNPKFAIYTLGDEDIERRGKKYLSIKKRYLECADPTEWEFANRWFLNWNHWERLCENKAIRPHIDQWRKELEVKLRSEAVKEMIAKSQDPKNVTATKWLAEGQWKGKRLAGAPSKEEKQRAIAIETQVQEEVSDDIERMAKWH